MEKLLEEARARAMAGGRLSIEDALALYEEGDLLFLARAARAAKERVSGKQVFYSVSLHVNLTNICTSNCPLCAFQVEDGDRRGYLLPLAEVKRRLVEARETRNLSQVHIVSALHPEADFDYYRETVRLARRILPSVEIQGFTPVEVVNFAKISGLTVEKVLRELISDGLTGLPGGGAEIFAPRVRELICPKKCTGEEWQETIRTAQRLGLKTNASMLFGHIETARERFEHLAAIRALQDEARAEGRRGFDAFMLFPFHPAHTKLAEERGLRRVGSTEDLKMMALSRLMLDNVPHLKAFWVMLTMSIAELALGFGADDLDGTIGEEKIIHAAGARTAGGITRESLSALIRGAGYEPCELYADAAHIESLRWEARA